MVNNSDDQLYGVWEVKVRNKLQIYEIIDKQIELPDEYGFVGILVGA